MPSNQHERRNIMFYLRQGAKGWGTPRDYLPAYAFARAGKRGWRYDAPDLRRYQR